MSPSLSPFRTMAPLIWLGALLPVALLAAVFLPAGGQPAMLYPLSGQSPADAIGWGKDNAAPFLGLSSQGDAAILHLSAGSSALDALRSGFVPIGMEGGICTSTSTSTGIGTGIGIGIGIGTPEYAS
ncbi:hypothetical protein [Alteraurantiacibacter palmitatis]|uniref:Uncharacterized protein n=1 Tax=Alteraurantiacibacter palmitatis TaxID=2054628 RepID=A0ABV7E797_9SPHN